MKAVLSPPQPTGTAFFLLVLREAKPSLSLHQFENKCFAALTSSREARILLAYAACCLDGLFKAWDARRNRPVEPDVRRW